MARKRSRVALIAGLVLVLGVTEAVSGQCNSAPPFRPAGAVRRGPVPGQTPSAVPSPTPTPTVQGPAGGITPSPRSSGTTPRSNVPRGGITPRRKNLARKNPGIFDWQGWWNANSSLFFYGPRRVQHTPGGDEIRAGGTTSEGHAELIDHLSFHMTVAKDELFRQDCALTLGRIGGEASLLALRRVLASRVRSSDELVESVAMGLAHSKSEAALSVLRPLVVSKQRPVATRGIAAAALGVLGTIDQETVRFLMKIVEDPGNHEDLRASCALALGAMRGSYSSEFLVERCLAEETVYLKSYLLTALSLTAFAPATPVLMGATESSDLPVRWAATIALGGFLDGVGSLTGERVDDAGWVPKELEKARKDGGARLRELARAGKDERTRALAAISLGRVGGAESVATLEQLSRTGRGQLRSAACLGLALSGDIFAEKQIVRLLMDGSEVDVVRAAGAAALGFLPVVSPSARRSLQTAIAFQNPGVVRHYASLSLGMIGDHASFPKLKRILGSRRENAGIRVAAARGLCLLGSPGAIQAVSLAIATEKDDWTKQDFLGCLGSCPTKAPVPLLLEIMRDEDVADGMRGVATHAYGHVVNRYRPPLFARLLCNRNYFLRAKPLESLGGRL